MQLFQGETARQLRLRSSHDTVEDVLAKRAAPQEPIERLPRLVTPELLQRGPFEWDGV